MLNFTGSLQVGQLLESGKYVIHCVIQSLQNICLHLLNSIKHLNSKHIGHSSNDIIVCVLFLDLKILKKSTHIL